MSQSLVFTPLRSKEIVIDIPMQDFVHSGDTIIGSDEEYFVDEGLLP